MSQINSVVLLGWTTISRKQIYQVEHYARIAEHVYCISNDSLNDSTESIVEVRNQGNKNVDLISLKGKKLTKAFAVLSLLRKAKGPRKVAIIAPAGRMSGFYFACSKLLGFKTIVVEWGSIADLEELDFLTAFNMQFCYRFAKAIWYKEPYMKDLLTRYRPLAKQGMFFIPNSSKIPPVVARLPYSSRDIHYLWVNRIVGKRYPELMIKGVKHLAGMGIASKSVIMGFLPHGGSDLAKEKMVEGLASANSIETLPFSNPFPYYRRAKYFILIADQAFGNNSLLESMHFGVVPVVNYSHGIDLWLKHGDNAIVFNKDMQSIEGIFEALSKIAPAEWERLSNNAISTALHCSKLEDWKTATDSMLTHVFDA